MDTELGGTVLDREKRIYKGKSDDLGVGKVIRNSENQGGSKEKLKFRVFQYTGGIVEGQRTTYQTNPNVHVSAVT